MFRIAGDNPDGSIAVQAPVGIVDVYVHSPYAQNRGALMPAWAWTASVGGTDIHDIVDDHVYEAAQAAVSWLAEQVNPPLYF